MENTSSAKTIPQVCAELVIDKEKLSEAAGTAPSEEELIVRMDDAIRGINKNLPQYNIIRYFVLTYEPIEIITTLKIKRTIEYGKIKARLNTSGTDMRKASGKYMEAFFQHIHIFCYKTVKELDEYV